MNKYENFIFVTDVHFHPFTEFAKSDEEYINSRFREQVEVMSQVFELAREHDAIIINGGDLFHQRGKVDTEVFNKVYKLFSDNSDVPIIHVVGNHDMKSNMLGSPNSLELFDLIENSTVSSEPEVIEVGEARIYTLPYGDEHEEMKEWLSNQKVEEDFTNILVGHLGLEGSSTGSSSHRLSGAFSYGDLKPQEMGYILLGHFHKKQRLGDNQNGNHVYGGSLLQNNFGEQHETGVHLGSLTDDKELEFIPIESTKFVTIQADDIPEDFDETMEKSYIRFIGQPSDMESLEIVSEESGQSIDNVRLQIKKDYTTDLRIDISEENTPVEIITKYMDEFYPEAKEEAVSSVRDALNSK